MSTFPFVSPGTNHEGLVDELSHASGDDILALLIGSRILPERMKDARILPVVIYGADPYKIEHPSGGHMGVVDLLPATASHLGDTLYDEYFNPHGALKKAAERVDVFSPARAEGKLTKHKGKRFHYPGYVIGERNGRHLFAEISPDDLELRRSMLSELARVYDLGTVAIGDQIVYGNESHRLPRSGIPAIVREIGQTIFHLPYTSGAKVVLLKEVVKSLEANRSPNYRHVPVAQKNRTKRRIA